MMAKKENEGTTPTIVETDIDLIDFIQSPESLTVEETESGFVIKKRFKWGKIERSEE